jgi:hypothetical protein
MQQQQEECVLPTAVPHAGKCCTKSIITCHNLLLLLLLLTGDTDRLCNHQLRKLLFQNKKV